MADTSDTGISWGRLTRRAEFQRVARGKRAQAPGLTLQANRRAEPHPEWGPRVGFTVTKKVGVAVVRNRIRRRLREALKRVSPDAALGDHDYVVMAREAALSLEFAALVEAICRAFVDIQRARPRSGPSGETRDRRP